MGSPKFYDTGPAGRANRESALPLFALIVLVPRLVVKSESEITIIIIIVQQAAQARG